MAGALFSPLAAANSIPPLERPPRRTPAAPARPVRWLPVLFCGAKGVGKTSLIKRHYEGTFAPTNSTATIGVDYGTKVLTDFESSEFEYKAAFIDTSGDPIYSEIAVPFLSEQSVVVICCSASEVQSLNHAVRWAAQANAAREGRRIVALAVLRCDEKWAFSREEVAAVAQRLSCPVFEVAVSSGQGVAQLFKHVYREADRILPK